MEEKLLEEKKRFCEKNAEIKAREREKERKIERKHIYKVRKGQSKRSTN
jgi:hypothetical protein